MNRTLLSLAWMSFAVAAFAGDAPGDGDDIARLARACEASSNLDARICRCVAEKAHRELTPKGMALLIAGMEEDQARADELRKDMSMEELMMSGMFMTHAPADCAKSQ